VEGYHAMGIGYGILAQFYSIANGRCGATSSFTVAQLIEMKQSGMGMGEIRTKALGSASAKDCNLGRLKQGDLDEADAKSPPAQDKAKDQDKDKNKDKGKQQPKKPAAPAQPPKKAQPPKQPKQPKKEQPKQPKQEKPKEEKKGNDGGGKGKK
jgi:outer membrane biosynthesis protein TonB